jgi:uncharacterized hydrophobic protein (TIGR00271 family)
MSIAIYVNSNSDARSLIGWGVRFAEASHSDLLIVVPRRQKGKAKWDPLERSEADQNELYQAVFDQLAEMDPKKVVLKQDITEGAEASDMDRILVETRELVATNPETSFVEEVATLNISLLIVPAHESAKSSTGETNWTQQLFDNAPCETISVRGNPPPHSEPLSVLVATEQEEGSALMLKRAASLVRESEVDQGSVTFLFVRPDDDEVAPEVAHYHMDRVIGKVKTKLEIKKQVHLGDSFSGSLAAQPLNDYDLVLIGSRKHKRLRKFFRVGSEQEQPLGFAALRPAVPAGNRFWTNVKAKIRRGVPQLDRESRIRLVDKLQSGSHFNFDFCALIALSTLIAALGLVDNSAAVVIGAMLVAPLMTPLVGIGFALVQGNEKLIRTAVPAVGLGFLVAFIIGCVVGILITLFTDLPISSEMASRDLPTLIDLFVALASGIAGAYALGRPDLLSALPGVAIAAALVPPIATSGMALTMGDLVLCGGALLLFLTNIVVIVLGTALTFSAVGIDTRKINAQAGSDKRAAQWPRYVFGLFVILSFALATEMAIFNPVKAPKVDGKPAVFSPDPEQTDR